jgi:hypothetical protein
MMPGMSAMTKLRSGPSEATPRFGHERRERVVGDLRAGRRHGGDERALADVGETDDADVCEELQLEAQIALFTRRARRGAPWRAIDAAFEARVAEAMKTALRHQQPRAVTDQVADQFLGIGVVDQGALGHSHDEVVGTLADAIRTLSGLAVGGAKQALEAEIDQRVQARIDFQVDAAAIAAVATVGATARNEFLTAKTQAAVTAVAGLDGDQCFVDEFHGRRLLWSGPKQKTPSWTGFLEPRAGP